MPDNSEFVRSLENASVLIVEQMVGKMKRACLAIESEAKANCPVNEGPLRASITSDTSLLPTEIVGMIGSNLMYAPYVHNGTGIYAVNGDGRKTPWTYHVASGMYAGFYFTEGQKPQPFLEDAKMHNIDRVSRILGGK